MSKYTVAGLEHGIGRCEHNIAVLRAAIKREQQTIAEYRAMIARLQAPPPVVVIDLERSDEGDDDEAP